MAAGQTVAVEGANRSGKTLLLRSLGRELAGVTQRGALRFQDREVLSLSDSEYDAGFLRHVAFVRENAGSELFPGERVHAQLRGPRSAPGKEEARNLLTALGVADPEAVLSLRVLDLSRGLKLAIAVAKALASKPRLLVLDDVLLARDALSTAQWLSHVRHLQDTEQLAVLLLCRRAASYSMLRPIGVVQLEARRALCPPSQAALDALASETPRPRPAGKPLLRAEHLSVAFARDQALFAQPRVVQALVGLSLQVRAGEVVGLTGGSPSGKTTLAFALAQLIPATLGRVTLRIRADRAALGRRRPVLICFEDALESFDPRLQIGAQLLEAAHLRDESGDAAERLLNACIAAVGLEPDRRQRTRSALSQAELQLLALARALLLDPSVVILDNALSAVDSERRDTLLKMLRDRCKRRGLGAVVMSHEGAALSGASDRLGVMYAGRLIENRPDSGRAGRAASSVHPLALGLRAHATAWTSGGRRRRRSGPESAPLGLRLPPPMSSCRGRPMRCRGSVAASHHRRRSTPGRLLAPTRLTAPSGQNDCGEKSVTPARWQPNQATRCIQPCRSSSSPCWIPSSVSRSLEATGPA